MKADWKECPRGDVVGQWAALYVTMNRKGQIVMNRAAYKRLGEPRAVHLLFDKPNSRIGVKPTVPAMRNAFPVGPNGRHGGKIIRAFRLAQEFGIDLSETIQFRDAEVDTDGILVLNLRTATVSERAKGQGRGRSGAALNLGGSA